MSEFYDLIQLPRLAAAGMVAAALPRLRRSSSQATSALQAALAAASPGQMGPTWQVQPLGAIGVLGGAVGTLAPGAAALNYGAHWPGKMPPAADLAAWAASKGLNPFAVARMLKLRGGFAPAYGGRYAGFVERTLTAQQDQLVALIQRNGVRSLLEGLSSHG